MYYKSYDKNYKPKVTENKRDKNPMCLTLCDSCLAAKMRVFEDYTLKAASGSAPCFSGATASGRLSGSMLRTLIHTS